MGTRELTDALQESRGALREMGDRVQEGYRKGPVKFVVSGVAPPIRVMEQGK